MVLVLFPQAPWPRLHECKWHLPNPGHLLTAGGGLGMRLADAVET